nr:uncharacterized protein LOC111510674 [Leptinotarsa decemlineata]
MDSFYDMPRKAPTPTNIEKCLIGPTVPEISMVCTPSASSKDFDTYNAWKNSQQNSSQGTNILTSTADNFSFPRKGPFFIGQNQQLKGSQDSSQFLKKQVRFESPPLQQRPSLSYEPFVSRKELQNQQNKCFMDSVKNGQQKLCAGTPNAFEQIYMANVPSRQLDLSIIELPSFPKKKDEIVERETQAEQQISCHDCNETVDGNVNFDKNKENELPKTYKDFLKLQKHSTKERYCPNDSVTDIFNYKRNQYSNMLKETEIFKNTTNLQEVQDKKLDNVENMNYREKMYKNQFRDHYWLTESDRTRKAIEQVPEYQNQEMKNINFPNVYNSTNQRYDRGNDTETQTDNSCELQTTSVSKVSNDSEPSTKDLLKIIAQQNEQLLLLQSQVALLLNRDQNQTKPIEDVRQKVDYVGEKCVTSTQNEPFRQENYCSPRKRGLSKFSIDLMTSFEVAIRPQQKQNFINCEPKIQEITESDNGTSNREIEKNDKNMYRSLHLGEPVVVQESCPSPEPSININMNDYDSSDDEVSASEISATFYNNLMDQVNNILKKAQIETRDDLVYKQEMKSDRNAIKNNRTIHRVREATLKHLKNIGVTIGPMDDFESSTSVEHDEKNYNPTEISFAVKQLLMKYLPDDQLARLSHKQEKSPENDKQHGIMTARPEFSLASVQYMKKYNLIQSEDFSSEVYIEATCKRYGCS